MNERDHDYALKVDVDKLSAVINNLSLELREYCTTQNHIIVNFKELTLKLQETIKENRDEMFRFHEKIVGVTLLESQLSEMKERLIDIAKRLEFLEKTELARETRTTLAFQIFRSSPKFFFTVVILAILVSIAGGIEITKWISSGSHHFIGMH